MATKKRARTSKRRTPRAGALNARQQRFVEEYLVDLNASQAALRAGYSPKTAHAIGSENLQKPEVAAAIQAAQRARSERTGITQDRVLTELEHLAFSNIDDYVMTDAGRVELAEGAPKHAMRAVSKIKRKVTRKTFGQNTIDEVEVELGLWDKPGTLKLAGRHVGLFADRLELTGKNGGPILTKEVAEQLSDEDLAAQLAAYAAKAGVPR